MKLRYALIALLLCTSNNLFCVEPLAAPEIYQLMTFHFLQSNNLIKGWLSSPFIAKSIAKKIIEDIKGSLNFLGFDQTRRQEIEDEIRTLEKRIYDKKAWDSTVILAPTAPDIHIQYINSLWDNYRMFIKGAIDGAFLTHAVPISETEATRRNEFFHYNVACLRVLVDNFPIDYSLPAAGFMAGGGIAACYYTGCTIV